MPSVVAISATVTRWGHGVAISGAETIPADRLDQQECTPRYSGGRPRSSALQLSWPGLSRRSLSVNTSGAEHLCPAAHARADNGIVRKLRRTASESKKGEP